MSGTTNYFLCVEGEIDLASAPEFDRVLHDAIRYGRGNVVVDFTDVSFLDSSGVHVLTRAVTALRDEGRTLRLVNVRNSVRLAIDIAGLDGALASHVLETR